MQPGLRTNHSQMPISIHAVRRPIHAWIVQAKTKFAATTPPRPPLLHRCRCRDPH